jgi:hypothetical protein
LLLRLRLVVPADGRATPFFEERPTTSTHISRVRARLSCPLASYRCAGADPIVRTCVIPSLSRNCTAISAQARIGSSSAHFTSIALSPCSTRKWAALEGGGPSPRGLPGGCGACPLVVGLPGCGAGEGAAAGADGRGPLESGCGGCPNAAVASSAAPTPKYTVDCFNAFPPWLMRRAPLD